MTKQEMIDFVYKKIADKTLSFGCRIEPKKFGIKEAVVCTCYQNNSLMYITDSREGSLVGDFLKKEERVMNLTGFLHEGDYNVIGHPVMLGDVLDWAEKTICKKRSICCPLCGNKIEIEEDEIGDFGRIYQKGYFACVDNECGFYTTNSSGKNNSQYECEGEKKNIERDFCVPEYFSRPISDKIYGDIADTAYADQNESIDIYWKDKRKPIQDQPIECIEYIYNLLP